MVVDGYYSFSPALGRMVERAAACGRLDVPAEPGRRGGAFNYTVILPGNQPISFVFQSYQGSSRDAMTLAHELGHYCHGLLAGEAQGALMYDAPMAYCETASVFGESVVFEHLLKQAEQSGNLNEQLVLLTDKANDILNTVVRQIGFSEFERRIHGVGRRLAPAEFDKIWVETAQALYGPDGDIFTYEDTDHLWTYVHHFHRPFYVYSYAFGELLTHSLRAKAGELGDRFEPLYLEMLQAGGTKEAVDLLAPFGLDPRDPEFWTNGLKISLQKVVEKAEAVAKQLGY
jgi:oligoendopeptidase F